MSEARWSGDAEQFAPQAREPVWRYHVKDAAGVTWGRFHSRSKAREFAKLHRPPMRVVDTKP